MIVCVCKGLNEREIWRAIATGAVTVMELGRCCGAGTDCGACRRELALMLGERFRADSGSAADPIFRDAALA